MWVRRALLMRMRPSDTRCSATWSAQKRPTDPGIAWETKRSWPSIWRHFFSDTREVEERKRKISARVALRCGGSSKVCRWKSSIHPRMTFRGHQLASPLRIFLTEAASFRLTSPGRGLSSTSSMACRRWSRWELRRRCPP